MISSDQHMEATSCWSGFLFRGVLVWLEAKLAALEVGPAGLGPLAQ